MFLEASLSSVPASPRIVMESDGGSQASGGTSRASVDEDDDVPITEIYFVSHLSELEHDVIYRKCNIICSVIQCRM